MKPGGLVGLLNHTVAAGDINACCGVLRRIYSETYDEDTHASVTSRQRGTAAAYRRRPTPSMGHNSVTDSLHNKQTYTTTSSAAPTLTSSSDLSPVTGGGLSLIQRVVQLGRACLKDDAHLVKPSSVSVLCHTAQRAGDWELALNFCRHLPQPPSPVFTSSLLTPENLKAVLNYCETHGFSVDTASAIRVLGVEQGSWSAALAAAQEAERRWPCGERYSVGVLVPYLAASGAHDQAVTMFEAAIAQGSLVEPELVQHLILQTAELRQWPTCLHMLRSLTRMHEAGQMLPDSASFFRVLMEASPNWETSLCILRTAMEADAKPDERTLSILLSQCDQAGAWEEATKVYDMAVKGNFVDSLAQGSTYHALVRSFSAAQQWTKALEALSWMGKAGDASMAAGKCELVELCEQNGQWEAALMVGKELLESSPELLSAHTTTALLFACAKGAQWQMATRIVRDQLKDVRVQPHPMSVCAALQACAAAKQWEAAMQLLQEAREQQPRTVVPPMAHRLVVKACVRSGRWSEVLEALACMRHDGLPQDNNNQRLGMWAAALSGQWELSLSFLQGIPIRSRTPQDRMVVRSSTRAAGPIANAMGLQYLQAPKRS